MFDPYRDSLEDVIVSNIDDGLPSRNNYLWSSKPSALALQSGKTVLLLFELFCNGSKAICSKGINLKQLPTGNSALRLLLNIVL